MMYTIAFQIPGMGEWVVIAALGLLFFGKRLPEVGRSLGKGIVEFKKGLKGIEDEIDVQVDDASRDQEQRRITTTTTQALPQARFDPMTGKPIVQPEHRFDPYTGEPIAPPHDASGAASNGVDAGASVAQH